MATKTPTPSRRRSRRTGLSRSRTVRSTRDASTELNIPPAVRAEWARLTERWEKLLPRLSPGRGKRAPALARRG